MCMSIGRTLIVKGVTYKNIEDGNKDNQCKGVEIGENVVGKTMCTHRRSLRRKVVTQLVICQPYYRLAFYS